MNSLEQMLLNIGFSWQLSMLLPFFIILVLGTSIGFMFLKSIKATLWRSSLSICIGIVLSGVYFAFYPIYISDLENEFRIEKNLTSNVQNGGFMEVLVLPDCPHCIYSIDLVKKLALRNAGAQIVYKIVSNDGYGGGIEAKLKAENMRYSHVPYNADIQTLSKGSYPSFIFHEKDAKVFQVWNNNAFGSKALDFIESKLNRD